MTTTFNNTCSPSAPRPRRGRPSKASKALEAVASFFDTVPMMRIASHYGTKGMAVAAVVMCAVTAAGGTFEWTERAKWLTLRSVAGSVRGAESAEIEVACYAASYSDSVELAEAVRAALDRRQAEAEGLHMRCCTLIDSSEDYYDDAYIQTLVFDVKV